MTTLYISMHKCKYSTSTSTTVYPLHTICQCTRLTKQLTRLLVTVNAMRFCSYQEIAHVQLSCQAIPL